MNRQIIGSDAMRSDLLINQLNTSPFFFSSPTTTLLASEQHAYHQGIMGFDKLPEYVEQLLQQAKTHADDNPIALGIIPFSEHNPVQFVIPETLHISAPMRGAEIPADLSPIHHKQSRLQPFPAPKHYINAVSSAVKQCKQGHFNKVVLSRSIQIDTEEAINVPAFINRLLGQNPGGYTFCSRIGNTADTRLVGSSPELLVSRKGQHVCSNPLAGSRRRGVAIAENAALSNAMCQNPKDLHEHSVVVDAVEAALAPYCSNLYVPMTPSVIETATMLHLSTKIEGTVTDPTVSALTLASKLHPTPAVCGHPQFAAHNFIKSQEPFDRGYFTGLIGWCDARGNGEWVVVIRSAEIQANRLKLFAGAGIVQGSDPIDELKETGNKMRTILHALNLDLAENDMMEPA
ncbi:isochorismate synthase [Algibacillus agarilyticus]|uniref:isochorismate synthase n=1 Tax=Algibacillus agarilyticus TaxID=2234133 RepID=UPI0018E590EF|nr:isochorismate synthase [Algibacillus agarilyticus]